MYDRSIWFNCRISTCVIVSHTSQLLTLFTISAVIPSWFVCFLPCGKDFLMIVNHVEDDNITESKQQFDTVIFKHVIENLLIMFIPGREHWSPILSHYCHLLCHCVEVHSAEKSFGELCNILSQLAKIFCRQVLHILVDIFARTVTLSHCHECSSDTEKEEYFWAEGKGKHLWSLWD